MTPSRTREEWQSEIRQYMFEDIKDWVCSNCAMVNAKSLGNCPYCNVPNIPLIEQYRQAE